MREAYGLHGLMKNRNKEKEADFLLAANENDKMVGRFLGLQSTRDWIDEMGRQTGWYGWDNAVN